MKKSHLLALMLAIHGVSALAADIEKGKVKAAACVGCHGANGMGLAPEFPNLAGQKAPYLARQLRAFKSGVRADPSMKAMTANLSEDDMQNLAAYFASLPRVAVAAPAPKAAPLGKATATEFPDSTFITMKKSGTVTAFPAGDVWAGGPDMLYDAITPDGKMVLATSPSSDSVYIFDAASGRQLAVVPVGKAPKGVKVAPDGKVAYVSNQGSAEVSVVDLATLKVVASIKVEEGPHNARFTRDGRTAYVTLQGGAGIGVIDTARREQVRVIPVPGITGPHNLDLSADEKTAYVRDFVHHVAVVDLESGAVRRVIKVGAGHGGIDVSPDGRFIATAAIGDNIVSLIDPETLAVTNIEVGDGPHGIRASQDGRWIYVTLTNENAIAVINTATKQVEKKIPGGEFPFWVAVPGNP